MPYEPKVRRVTDEDIRTNEQLRELMERQQQTVEQQLAKELKAIISRRVPNARRAEQLYREVYDFLSRTVIVQPPPLPTEEANGSEPTN